jgi:signal transduction histidine kinase
MMLVVGSVTAVAVLLAQRDVAANFQRDLEREFQGELAAFHAVQAVRDAALAERCRALARRPRIHAALEDDALDLLYLSARDELVDVTGEEHPEPGAPAAPAFHARFYRFLDGRGAVIAPPDDRGVGPLLPAEQAQLALPAVPDRVQTGYLWRETGGAVDEVIAMPIVSTENGRAIAALVLGFKPGELPGRSPASGMISGIWTGGRLYLPAMTEPARTELAGRIAMASPADDHTTHSFTVDIAGAPSLLFYRRLNPASPFPPACEVCIYPLTASLARQQQLFWQFSGAGAALLTGAFLASHFLSRRLSRPVEKLAVASEENRAQRQRAEVALELTHAELQRSARFSADASHQLKTPVTVLRAGLEELQAENNLSPEVREEIATLIHQTFRLTSVIEDLLLLSRMDAGRLQLTLVPVDLSRLIAGWLDDLGALPAALDLKIETDIPPELCIEGEERYTTLILQNLLENARRYNRPGGRIRVTLRAEDAWGILTVGNTGEAIPAAAREHIFQRFHRGTAGENLPGHGLGLNLARELARLHRGDLRLATSESDWTEFAARFRLAPPTPARPPGPP